LVNELYADDIGRCYGVETIGLRYFNVFGPRQDPDGAYAAVIPRWAALLLAGRPVTINGDGETTRDFCYVDNVVQANLLAATTTEPAAIGQVYNVAIGGRLSLNALHDALAELVRRRRPELRLPQPHHRPFREGDVRHSQADIGKIARRLGYEPTHDVAAGLAAALPWYEAHVPAPAVRAVGT
jgi:UDP-N-acetylglucosamine 4-epimerase